MKIKQFKEQLYLYVALEKRIKAIKHDIEKLYFQYPNLAFNKEKSQITKEQSVLRIIELIEKKENNILILENEIKDIKAYLDSLPPIDKVFILDICVFQYNSYVAWQQKFMYRNINSITKRKNKIAKDYKGATKE